jgi:IS30 family transposase
VSLNPDTVSVAIEDIEAVAHALNSRPRKILGWKMPAEALNEHLLLL